jgi:hypothetical protein
LGEYRLKTRSKTATPPKKTSAKKKESVKAISVDTPSFVSKKKHPRSQMIPAPGMIHFPSLGFENAFKNKVLVVK